MLSIGFIHSLSYLFFLIDHRTLLWAQFMSLFRHTRTNFSRQIFLLMYLSLDVHYKVWSTSSFRPGAHSYNFALSHNLNQIVNFSTCLNPGLDFILDLGGP